MNRPRVERCASRRSGGVLCAVLLAAALGACDDETTPPVIDAEIPDFALMIVDPDAELDAAPIPDVRVMIIDGSVPDMRPPDDAAPDVAPDAAPSRSL